MYYVCIAYYLENDIRWRLMAYRYFETYMFSTGRNTSNSKNTTYFWFGGDNKPRGFLLSNIQFVFMALACIFFYCMPLSTDEEPFLLCGQLNIAISARAVTRVCEWKYVNVLHTVSKKNALRVEVTKFQPDRMP